MLKRKKQKKPKISVVMSVFNEKKYLEKAIKSIINQSFSNFEFIIIDDGSADGSAEMLDDWAKEDKRIKIIHQKNIGLTKSLNKGIKIARGKYIARMDADDISMPTRLEKEINYLKKNPKTVLVSSFVKIIDEKGHEIGELTPAVTYDKIKKMSIFSCQIYHSSSMFGKKIFEKIGGYNEKYIYAQDIELWFKFMKAYQVANIPEFLLLWRKSPKGIGVRKRRDQEKFDRKAKMEAIRNGFYPWYYVFFLAWPFIRPFIPSKLRDSIKKEMYEK